MLKDTDSVAELQTELRATTRDLHHRLDHHDLLAPLVRSSLDVADYALALQALYAINAPTEQAISDYIDAQGLAFDYASRRRMPDLLADLEYFGLSAPQLAWGGPSIRSHGQLVGCLYVLEGSTMGGRVIYKQLQSVLKLNQQTGGRFFAGHGELTMPMWQAFWTFAAEICSPGQITDATQAASALFESILAHLDRRLP
jgi:heme oxygenase